MSRKLFRRKERLTHSEDIQNISMPSNVPPASKPARVMTSNDLTFWCAKSGNSDLVEWGFFEQRTRFTEYPASRSRHRSC